MSLRRNYGDYRVVFEANLTVTAIKTSNIVKMITEVALCYRALRANIQLKYSHATERT